MAERRTHSLRMYLAKTFIVAAGMIGTVGGVRAAISPGTDAGNFPRRWAYMTLDTCKGIYDGCASFVSDLRND